MIVEAQVTVDGSKPAIWAAIVDGLARIADARGATPAQVALAWLLTRPGVTAPIASATSVAQLDELIGATRITLDDGDLAALDRASAPP